MEGCGTSESWLCAGWGIDTAECPELEALREVLNGGFARLEDAVTALSPLLELLPEGEAYPAEGGGRFFWDVPDQLTSSPATSMAHLDDDDYDTQYEHLPPVFLYPSQRRSRLNMERVDYYRERLQQDGPAPHGLALGVVEGVSVLLDGHHDLEAIACWVYDIPSGQAVQTLAQSPYYHQSKRPYGIIPFYGSSCMEIGRDGSVCLIDRTTGARTIVQSFTFEKGMGFLLNPSGTKLLYYNMDSDADGLGITQLGVIELEKGTFIAFDREGYEDLCEGSLHWQDDQTVSISADSSDGGTQYILLYQF